MEKRGGPPRSGRECSPVWLKGLSVCLSAYGSESQVLADGLGPPAAIGGPPSSLWPMVTGCRGKAGLHFPHQVQGLADRQDRGPCSGGG